MIFAGADFGGSAVKVALVSDRGEVVASSQIPFDPTFDFEPMVGAVAERIVSLSSEFGIELAAIGISTPGYAHPATGILIDGTNNVPSLRDRSIPAFLGERLGVPAFIDNDGICATLGEMLFGAGRELENFALITIGTGIGGGIVIGRRIVIGRTGQPPEIGAMCLDPNGPVNYSGIAGTFEELASGPALVRAYRARSGAAVGEHGAKRVFELAADGDPNAEQAIDAMARTIAQAFGSLFNVLNLDACLIGGGLSAAGSDLIDRIAAHLPSFTWPMIARNARVGLAELGAQAGVVGAAANAMDRSGSSRLR